LVDHFVARANRQHHRNIKGVSPIVLKKLISYPWPGNIRELAHTIERAVILCKTDEITAVQLFDQPKSSPSPMLLTDSLPETLAQTERRIIIDALKNENGVQAAAARKLGISRANLGYRIRKLGIGLRELDYE